MSACVLHNGVCQVEGERKKQFDRDLKDGVDHIKRGNLLGASAWQHAVSLLICAMFSKSASEAEGVLQAPVQAVDAAHLLWTCYSRMSVCDAHSCLGETWDMIHFQELSHDLFAWLSVWFYKTAQQYFQLLHLVMQLQHI